MSTQWTDYGMAEETHRPFGNCAVIFVSVSVGVS